nr:immunoglobulin heavy chain junction region [Macaca mulatta]MOX37765.1 immunoglobulin heavy chain junction region [Macaca mulatta]MOX40750.1 immunoglobulin heavy chain junction region [Macaca mulatta]
CVRLPWGDLDFW